LVFGDIDPCLNAPGEVNRNFKSPTTPSFPARFSIEHCNGLQGLLLKDWPSAVTAIGWVTTDQRQNNRPKPSDLPFGSGHFRTAFGAGLIKPKRLSFKCCG
jgi:hypothetical protein